MFVRLYLALRKWINGTFTCIRCGKTFHLMIFGYGKTICPDCYRGGNPWIFFEDPIMRRLMR